MTDWASLAAGVAIGAAGAGTIWVLARAFSRRRGRSNLPGENPISPAQNPEPPAAPPPPRQAPARWARSDREALRLSERIVIELAREGRMDPDLPPRTARTQAGLAVTLQTTQSAVSKVLRRLVDAQVVREERRHVRSLPQRTKVYELTRRGESLAREVAARRNVSLLPMPGSPRTGSIDSTPATRGGTPPEERPH